MAGNTINQPALFFFFTIDSEAFGSLLWRLCCRVDINHNDNNRIVPSLKPQLAPIKAAVIPLKKNNEELVNLSKEIKSNLQKLGLGRVVLENSGNIGKNYRRHDEIGTPICLTVDFETLEDKSVTVRDRDTMKQERVSIENLSEYYKKYFN